MVEQCDSVQIPHSKDKIAFFILKGVMIKINRLHTMVQSNVNLIQLSEFDEYCSTQKYRKFVKVINEYYEKYQGRFQGVFQQLQYHQHEHERPPQQIFDQNFTEFQQFYQLFQQQVKLVIRELNHYLRGQLTPLQRGDQIPDHLQNDVVLLDYLVTLYQL